MGARKGREVCSFASILDALTASDAPALPNRAAASFCSEDSKTLVELNELHVETRTIQPSFSLVSLIWSGMLGRDVG